MCSTLLYLLYTGLVRIYSKIFRTKNLHFFALFEQQVSDCVIYQLCTEGWYPWKPETEDYRNLLHSAVGDGLFLWGDCATIIIREV